MSETPLWRMVAGQKTGPYPPEKLRPLMKDGRISPLDRFSYDGADWRPATEFPELLRPPAPPPAVRPPVVDPLAEDLSEDGGWSVPEMPRRGSVDADPGLDDLATKKLLAVIHGLIWVGVGVVVILVILMVVTTFLQKPAVRSSTAEPSASEATASGASAAKARTKPGSKSKQSEPEDDQPAAAVDSDDDPTQEPDPTPEADPTLTPEPTTEPDSTSTDTAPAPAAE
jgi:hypothetical protein